MWPFSEKDKDAHRKLDLLLLQGVRLMSAFDDVKAILADIAKDIDDLIAKLPAEGGMTAAEVDALKADMSAVAAKHNSDPV